MAGGQYPGPAGASGSSLPLEDGTLPLMPSPLPLPLGDDPKGASRKPSTPETGHQIANFADNQMGRVVGNGQCFALVDQALRNAGAYSADHYGPTTAGLDYVWGVAIGLSELRRGDVIQLRDYVCQVETRRPGGGGQRATISLPHHTAIVDRAGENGLVVVLHQNAPEGGPVARARLYFSSGTFEVGAETVTTTVSDASKFYFYRPQEP